MSKRNRQRKSWRCRNCRTPMHREIDSPAAKRLAAAATGSSPNADTVHVCGACKTCHKVVDGRLVRLSPAELFELHVECPRTMQTIENLQVEPTPPGTAAATIIPNQDRVPMSDDDTDSMSDFDDAPEAPALGTCCICGGTANVHTILMLHKLCPTPGRGWGCVVCGRESDGAVAVVCDACCAERADDQSRVAADLKFACKGYPGKDGRVPIAELTGTFDHDLTKHPKEA